MLVLLPPSEGKSAAAKGAPLDLAALSFPALNPTRERLVRALVGAGLVGDRARARSVLGLPPGLDGELDRNAALLTAPAAPAAHVYTGVLYEALCLASLDRGPATRANRRIVTVSALWGAVRPGDRIPAYRLAAGVRLPRVGALPASGAGRWGRPLGRPPARSAARPALHAVRGTVAARPARWPHAPSSVRVVDSATGKVVSHFNKATKGRMVRALLEAKADPRTEHGLVRALRDLGFAVEAGARPGALDVAQVV